MNPQHQQARNLYFQTEMTQAQIAAIVGVSDQTVYRWIKQNNWKQMKEAAKQAPIAIVEMLYKQLHALNEDICTRALPIPTLEEAEITRKLINSIDKLKRQASLSENIQVLMGFTGFLTKVGRALGQKVVTHADHYLKERTGAAPLGFYEEPEEDIVLEQPESIEQPQSTKAVEQQENKPQPLPVKNTTEPTPAKSNVIPLKKLTPNQQKLHDLSERMRLYAERKNTAK